MNAYSCAAEGDDLLADVYDAFQHEELESLDAFRTLAWKRELEVGEFLPLFREVAEWATRACDLVLNPEKLILDSFCDHELQMLLSFFARHDALCLLEDDFAYQQEMHYWSRYFEVYDGKRGVFIRAFFDEIRNNPLLGYEKLSVKIDSIEESLPDDFLQERVGRELLDRLLELGVFVEASEVLECCESFKKAVDYYEMLRLLRREGEVFDRDFVESLFREYGMNIRDFQVTVLSVLELEILKNISFEGDLANPEERLAFFQKARSFFHVHEDDVDKYPMFLALSDQHQVLLLRVIEHCIQYFEDEYVRFCDDDQQQVVVEDEYLYGSGGNWIPDEDDESVFGWSDPYTDDVVGAEDDLDEEDLPRGTGDGEEY